MQNLKTKLSQFVLLVNFNFPSKNGFFLKLTVEEIRYNYREHAKCFEAEPLPYEEMLCQVLITCHIDKSFTLFSVLHSLVSLFNLWEENMKQISCKWEKVNKTASYNGGCG